MPGNRRERRNAAAAVAKEFMHSAQLSGRKRPDWSMVVAMAGLAATVFVFVLIRTKLAIVGSLVVGFGCIVFIGVHLLTRSMGKRASEIKGWIVLVTVVSVALVSGVGLAGWPEPEGRIISSSDQYAMVAELEKQLGFVDIEAVIGNDEAYHYAERLQAIFQTAGWDSRLSTFLTGDRPAPQGLSIGTGAGAVTIPKLSSSLCKVFLKNITFHLNQESQNHLDRTQSQ